MSLNARVSSSHLISIYPISALLLERGVTGAIETHLSYLQATAGRAPKGRDRQIERGISVDKMDSESICMKGRRGGERKKGKGRKKGKERRGDSGCQPFPS